VVVCAGLQASENELLCELGVREISGCRGPKMLPC